MAAPMKGPTQKIHCNPKRKKENTLDTHHDDRLTVIIGSHGGGEYTNLVIPGLLIVVDNSSPQTPGRVDTGASDRNSGQVNHEHGKPNWKRCQNLKSKIAQNTNIHQYFPYTISKCRKSQRPSFRLV